MNRSSKRSMDPSRRTLHHSPGPPSMSGREMPTPSPDSAIAMSIQTNEDERRRGSTTERALAGVKEFNRVTSLGFFQNAT